MKYRFVLVLMSTFWLLSGCIDSTSKVQIEQDGSATIELTRLLDTTFPDNYISDNGTTFSPGEQDVERICSQMADKSNYPEGASVRSISRSSNCGVSVTIDVAAGGDIGAQLAQLEQTSFGPLSELFTVPNEEDYVVEQRDDQWIFKMPTPSIRRLNTSYLSKQDAESILALSDFSYEISLPGTAIADENNADNVVGGTFVWDIDPTNGPALLEARTTPPSQNVWQRFGLPVLAVGGAVLLLVGALMFFKSRRKPSKKPTSTADTKPRDEEQNRTQSVDFDSDDTDTSDDNAIASQDPTPTMATLPLGSSSPEWNEDLQMWLSNHEVKGRMFFDDKSQRWEPLR